MRNTSTSPLYSSSFRLLYCNLDLNTCQASHPQTQHNRPMAYAYLLNQPPTDSAQSPLRACMPRHLVRVRDRARDKLRAGRSNDDVALQCEKGARACEEDSRVVAALGRQPKLGNHIEANTACPPPATLTTSWCAPTSSCRPSVSRSAFIRSYIGNCGGAVRGQLKQSTPRAGHATALKRQLHKTGVGVGPAVAMGRQQGRGIGQAEAWDRQRHGASRGMGQAEG